MVLLLCYNPWFLHCWKVCADIQRYNSIKGQYLCYRSVHLWGHAGREALERWLTNDTNPSFPAGYKTTSILSFTHLTLEKKNNQKKIAGPKWNTYNKSPLFLQIVFPWIMKLFSMADAWLHRAWALHPWFGCANLNCPSGFKWPILWMHYFIQLELDIPQWWTESSLYLFQALHLLPSRSSSELYNSQYCFNPFTLHTGQYPQGNMQISIEIRGSTN